MSKKIVYISDFFADQILGGAELNDQELLNILKIKYEVIKINSHLVDLHFLEQNQDCFFIISNFINLSYVCKERLFTLNYVIYEHDHKYLNNRNPGLFKDFVANPSKIINFYFYKNANKILCQSGFHKNIVCKNLQLENVISLGGNLWSIEDLSLIRDLNKNEKKDVVSILDSDIPHKNTQGAIIFCNKKI